MPEPDRTEPDVEVAADAAPGPVAGGGGAGPGGAGPGTAAEGETGADAAAGGETGPDDAATGEGGAPRDAFTATEAFQAAALQAIAAAKVFLDLAEQVVRNPDALGQVTSSLSTVARGVLGVLAGVGPGAQATGSAAGLDEPGDPPLERIDVG